MNPHHIPDHHQASSHAAGRSIADACHAAFPHARIQQQTALGPRGATGSVHGHFPRTFQIGENRDSDQPDSVEVVTAGAQDELMQSLDYKLKTSNTSYVTAWHDVQYFPSSLSSFSPTTSRVCRIPLTSGTSPDCLPRQEHGRRQSAASSASRSWARL